ncbi:MAG: NAD(P)-dependent oxidoreductase [Chloroflexi bacterium]|nr:NAD(P)-dependent oxidoreductase [Chloroflexota bacterium]
MKKILLTGAAGRVGTAFRHFASDRYQFRLVDRFADKISEPGEHAVVEANLAELEVCQKVCKGMDAVVHLAADASPSADFYGSLLDNNIKTAYNIFRAAKDQNCQRVIFASSVQVIEGYPLDVQARVEMPMKPMNMYAVAKGFSELMGHYFAYAENLSCIGVRIGAFAENPGMKTPNGMDGRNLSAYVSVRDLSHLFVQCIDTPNVQFAVFQACSDNRFKRMDITNAREIVGYTPQDDAFEVFNVGIHNRERWYQEWQRGKSSE